MLQYLIWFFYSIDAEEIKTNIRKNSGSSQSGRLFACLADVLKSPSY